MRDVNREILLGRFDDLVAGWQGAPFDLITDMIEGAADVVKELGGLEQLEPERRKTVFDMISRQVQLGIDRGDFDTVFARKAAVIEVGEFKIARLQLSPGDVLVLKAPSALTPEIRESIKQGLMHAFPKGRMVLILEDGLELSAITETEALFAVGGRPIL